METKLKKNKIVYLLLFLLITANACTKKERNFAAIQDQLIEAGYEGRFQKPENTFEKTALSLLGVKDVISFKGTDNSFVIVQFNNSNDKDLMERVESLLDLIDGYLSEEDKQELLNSRDKLESHSIQHNDIAVIWENKKPEDAIKIVKRNF
jgi:hypothetical protein